MRPGQHPLVRRRLCGTRDAGAAGLQPSLARSAPTPCRAGCSCRPGSAPTGLRAPDSYADVSRGCGCTRGRADAEPARSGVSRREPAGWPMPSAGTGDASGRAAARCDSRPSALAIAAKPSSDEHVLRDGASGGSARAVAATLRSDDGPATAAPRAPAELQNFLVSARAARCPSSVRRRWRTEPERPLAALTRRSGDAPGGCPGCRSSRPSSTTLAWAAARRAGPGARPARTWPRPRSTTPGTPSILDQIRVRDPRYGPSTAGARRGRRRLPAARHPST